MRASWAGSWPNLLSWRVGAQPTWVVVLSRSRQSLPRTSSRHALGLEHHGGTRLLQSIGVASRSIGGLTPPLPNRPSVYRAPMADRRRALPPVHWRPFASVHRGLHHLPPVHRRTCTIDNHSSYQESNEAVPLALNLPLDECIINIFSLLREIEHR